MPFFHPDVIVAIIIAYFIGSLSSAVITCRLLGLPDPRLQGSGNPGATNVLRFGGKKAAMITLLGDTLKGVIPIIVAKYYGFDVLDLCCIAFAVFLGHLYPIFFRFQGGKGVATAFGCLIALSWPIGLLLLITWLAVAIITRYSSLAAIITALAAPYYAWFFTNPTYTFTFSLISALLIFRHRQNIRNLLQGTENKIRKKPK